MQGNIAKFISDPPQVTEDRPLKRYSQWTPEEEQAIIAATKEEGAVEAHSFIVISRPPADGGSDGDQDMMAVENVDSGVAMPTTHRTRSKAKASSFEPLKKEETLKKATFPRATAGRKKTAAKPDKKLPSR